MLAARTSPRPRCCGVGADWLARSTSRSRATLASARRQACDVRAAAARSPRVAPGSAPSTGRRRRDDRCARRDGRSPAIELSRRARSGGWPRHRARRVRRESRRPRRRPRQLWRRRRRAACSASTGTPRWGRRPGLGTPAWRRWPRPGRRRADVDPAASGLLDRRRRASSSTACVASRAAALPRRPTRSRPSQATRRCQRRRRCTTPPTSATTSRLSLAGEQDGAHGDPHHRRRRRRPGPHREPLRAAGRA